MPRPYVKRRTGWAAVVMADHFPDWPDWDEQVPIYDLRGYDEKTVKSVGVMFFTRLMPRADVIALKPGELLIVEFDKQMDLLHAARLARYMEAIKHDAVRKDWRERKISAAYVTPAYDARLEDEAHRIGARYIVEPEP